MRILNALNVKPRRTIRVALWTGEEQGLLGSRGYASQHFGSVPRSTEPDQLKLSESMRKVTGPLQLKPEQQKISGYFTDILNQFAVDFLKQKHTKPFLLYVSHKAVHPDLVQNADGSLSDPSAGKFLPAERHNNLYAGAVIPHRANYAKPPEGKPALLRQIENLPPLGPKTVTNDETIRNRLRMLASVDEGVGEILKTLEMQKQLDNTLIVSQATRVFYGEHG
jgi:arylsulfatase A-like enzyme